MAEKYGEIVKTESFELSTNQAGDFDSERLVLVLPGRLDTKDYPHMRSHVQLLAELGYFALSFDPPGTWQSPGEIELYTMTNYLKSITELIELYGDRPTTLIGHSRGGSMAMLGATKIDQVTGFAAIMSRSSASIRQDESKYTANDRVEISYRDDPFDPKKRVQFQLPMTYFEDAEQYNMREDLHACTKPKMFIYGNDDAIITPDTVIETYEYAADPKQIYSVDSEHDYRRHLEVIGEVNQKIKKFMREFQPLGEK